MPAHCTAIVEELQENSLMRIVPPYRLSYWRVNFSAMRKELLQELPNRGLARLNKQTVERFCWMKSVICLPTPRRKYFALFRRMRLFAWEAMNRSLSMYV